MVATNTSGALQPGFRASSWNKAVTLSRLIIWAPAALIQARDPGTPATDIPACRFPCTCDEKTTSENSE